jgi:acyl-CoA thioesterase FadM
MRIVARDTDALIAAGYIASVMVSKALEKPVVIPDHIKQALARILHE